jgi:hypothetical protein
VPELLCCWLELLAMLELLSFALLLLLSDVLELLSCCCELLLGVSSLLEEG